MESRNRRLVVSKVFDLISQGRQRESLPYFAADCRQHNPYVRGGMGALFDAMAAAQESMGDYPDPNLVVRSILVDGDLVATHTELLRNKTKLSEGGLRQIHLFRFRGEKIVEYWDVTQNIQSDMPNAANAFGEESE